MKKAIKATTLAFLLLLLAASTLLINNVNASNTSASSAQYRYYKYRDGKWWRVETDLITILFPADGKKPMFLWWYSNETDNIYVVKCKGLIEYLTIDYPYYLCKYEANESLVRERLEAKYAESGAYQTQIRKRIEEAYMLWLLGFHPAYLPFNACLWNLTGPDEVTREDGISYISFNFTLVEAPPVFDFAEGNVTIRCRFYAKEATEDVYGLYNYTVNAGELKMDIVVNNWNWNIDQLNELFETLHDEFGTTVPKLRAGLALWINLASIDKEKIVTAEDDADSVMRVLPDSSYLAPSEPIETNSATSDIIAGGQRIQVRDRMASETEPLNVENRLRERFRLRFARGSQTLAGFFDFVNKAVVIDSTGHPTEVNVTAAYIPAGNHMRLFIGYPYFGDDTLEHDPSIGVEGVTPWLPTNSVMLLIGATIVIAVAIATVKIRRKSVNVISIQ
jgi:hypothetical protein